MCRLYKKKGKVVSLFDAYTAKVKPYESDFSIRIDQVCIGKMCKKLG